MKKNKTILVSAVVMLLISAVIYSCKKDDTNNTPTVADAYVANWHALDTVYDAGGSITTNGVIDFSITKKDASNVYVISFLFSSDTVVYAATTTTLTYSSGGGSYASFYSNLVMTLSGNKIYYTRPVGSGVNRGTATKL